MKNLTLHLMVHILVYKINRKFNLLLMPQMIENKHRSGKLCWRSGVQNNIEKSLRMRMGFKILKKITALFPAQ